MPKETLLGIAYLLCAPIWAHAFLMSDRSLGQGCFLALGLLMASHGLEQIVKARQAGAARVLRLVAGASFSATALLGLGLLFER